jgi:hypothetical protein
MRELHTFPAISRLAMRNGWQDGTESNIVMGHINCNRRAPVASGSNNIENREDDGIAEISGPCQPVPT